MQASKGFSPRLAAATSEFRLNAIYSSRSSVTGSSERARCAGIHVANSPSSAIATTRPPNTSGSRGLGWYTIAAGTRLEKIPKPNPNRRPIPTSFRARPNAACNTSLRCAPSAKRIPARQKKSWVHSGSGNLPGLRRPERTNQPPELVRRVGKSLGPQDAWPCIIPGLDLVYSVWLPW